MSGPFVYRPPTIPDTYSASQFQKTPYTYTPRPSTPFIPDATLYPSSPYSRPSSLNASPIRGSVPLPRFNIPDRYPFPGTYEAGGYYLREPRRERLPSWQGGDQTPWYGGPPPSSAPVYDIGNSLNVSAGPQRRHSFSSAYRPSFDTLRIHPLLNAESPVPGFVFDLSLPVPEALLHYGGGRTSRVPPEDLAQSVTDPPTTRLRIVSDTLPREWEFGLDISPEDYGFYVRAGYDPPPITVQDVLSELHRHMQSPISHNDWAKLSQANIESVRRAFTRRCRAAPGGYEGYEAERAKGVKKVDYLWGNTMLVGLLKAGREDGFEILKFVTTDPYQPT